MDRRSLLFQAAGVMIAGGAVFAWFGVSPAAADALDDAKAAGLVGERPNGFLGLVRPNAPSSVRAMVDSINAQRRARYADIARRNNATVRDVGVLAGRKLIGSARAGTYVIDPSGAWRRK